MKKLLAKLFAPYRKRKLQKQLTMLYNLTVRIDMMLLKLGYNRQAKKQFWEEFMGRQAFRQDVFLKLFQEVYQEVSK